MKKVIYSKNYLSDNPVFSKWGQMSIRNISFICKTPEFSKKGGVTL